MSAASVESLLLHELKDLYYVEQKLAKVLRDVAGEVEDDRLSARITQHAEESGTHAKRLEQAFELLGEKPTAEQCPGFDGIKQEHDDFVAEEQPVPEIYDLFVAGAAGGRIERYEISGYSSAIQLATTCGLREIASLLTETLEEERTMLADSEALAAELAESMATTVSGQSSSSAAGLSDMTVEELRHAASDHGIDGRSSMSKADLVDALAKE